MFYTTNKNRQGMNPFLPILGNILNEVANAPIQDFAKKQAPIFNRPKANVIEFDNHFDIALAIPGVKKEDVKITLEKNTLVISAEKEATEDAPKYKFREFNFSNFQRKFLLPENIDNNSISAKFDAGILAITIQKLAEAQPKSVEIK